MLFQTSRAAAVVGMEPWQVQSYAKQGFVEPAVEPSGAGSRSAYDLLGLVKLAVLNRLNSDGFDLRAIRPIFASLFDLPFRLDGENPELERQQLEAWFRDRVLITCERFRLRKLVRRDRLAMAAAELMRERDALYIFDIGRTVGGLLRRLEEFGLVNSAGGES